MSNNNPVGYRPPYNPQYPHLTQPNPNAQQIPQNYNARPNIRNPGFISQAPLPKRPNSSPPPPDTRTLLAEIAQLKSQISHKARTPASEETLIMQAQVDSLTEYSTTLESSVFVLTQENIDVRTDCRAIETELNAIKQRASQLQVDNQKLNQYVAKIQADLMEKLACQSRAFQEAKGELEAKNASLSGGHQQQLSRQSTELRAALERENIEQETTSQLTRQVERLLLTETSLKQDLVDAFAHLDTMHEANRRLKKESSTPVAIKSDLATIEHVEILKRQELQTKSWQLKAEEISLLHQKASDDLAASKTRNKELQQEMDQISQSKLKEYRDAMDSMEIDHNEARKLLESKLKGLQTLSNESINSNTQLRTDLDCAEKDKLTLQSSLAALNMNDDVALLKKENVEVQKRLETQIENLKMKSEESQRSNLQLKSEISEMNKNNSDLQNSLDEYDAHITRIETQYSQLQNENGALKKSLDVKAKLLRDVTGGSAS